MPHLPSRLTITGIAATALLAMAVTAAWSAPATSKASDGGKTELVLSGSVQQPFAPGVAQSIDLVLSNPNSFDVIATADVTVVDATTKGNKPNPGCVGGENLRVVHGLVGTVTIPKKGTLSLSELGVPVADRPLVLMENLDVNQDACKGASFTLAYAGTATKK